MFSAFTDPPNYQQLFLNTDRPVYVTALFPSFRDSPRSSASPRPAFQAARAEFPPILHPSLITEIPGGAPTGRRGGSRQWRWRWSSRAGGTRVDGPGGGREKNKTRDRAELGGWAALSLGPDNHGLRTQVPRPGWGLSAAHRVAGPSQCCPLPLCGHADHGQCWKLIAT